MNERTASLVFLYFILVLFTSPTPRQDACEFCFDYLHKIVKRAAGFHFFIYHRSSREISVTLQHAIGSSYQLTLFEGHVKTAVLTV
jgi:hypothetical protein